LTNKPFHWLNAKLNLRILWKGPVIKPGFFYGILCRGFTQMNTDFKNLFPARSG